MSSPTVTLAGSTQTLFGTTDVATITYELAGFGNAIPCISGTALFTTISGSVTCTAGSYSFTVYGNDVITVGGVANTTWYVFKFFSSTGQLIATVPYQLAGNGTFDISSLTPLAAPVPPSSTPSSGLITALAAAAFSPFSLTVTNANGPSTTVTLGQIASNANLVFAGPASGAAANATMRALVVADIPTWSHVVYADQFTGSGNNDMGDKINTAYAALVAAGRSGMIYVPAGSYNFSTPIVLNHSGILVCLQGAPGATSLIFTPTTGIAITLDYIPRSGGGWIQGHGIRDINLYNVSTTLTSGGPNNCAGITAWSITSNVVTFTAANSFAANDVVTIDGFGTSTFFNGQSVTVLSTGLSGTQFEANFTHANASGTEYGFAYKTTNTAIGIKLGTGTNGGAQNGILANVMVGGFFQNILFSSDVGGASYGITFDKCSSVNGTFGYYFPAVGYENERIQAGMISENAIGIWLEPSASVDLFVDGPSFDSNTIFGFYAPGPSSSVSLNNCHWENNGITNAHYILSGLSTTAILGGTCSTDNVSGTQDWLIYISGVNAAIVGVDFFSLGQTVTQAINLVTGATGVAPTLFLASHNNSSAHISALAGGTLTNLLNFGITSGSNVSPTLPTLTLPTLVPANITISTHTADTAIIQNSGDLYFGAYTTTPQLCLRGTNGNVGINTNNPTTKLYVAGATTISTGGLTITAGGLTVSAGGAAITGGLGVDLTGQGAGTINTTTYYAAGVAGFSHASSDYTAFTFSGGIITAGTPSSDERIKRLIKPFTIGLDAIKAINPITYWWDKEKSGIDSDHEWVGFSAQNVSKVIPVATPIDPSTGYLELNVRGVIAALVNAVKELSAKVAELESRQ